jgi:nucleotide-binding universal stress UspA family protein
MVAFRNILVPVDSSETSRGAAAFAMALAKRFGASLVFAHSVDLAGAVSVCATPYNVPDVEPIFQALEDESKNCLDDAVARARAAGLAASVVELAGPPAGAILDALHDRSFDAIVMGTHGRSGASRFFLGSTAEGVLRGADVPVFIVPAGAVTRAADASAFESIEVALDSSEPSAAALQCALDIAVPGKTTVLVTHVVSVHEVYGMLGAHRKSAPVALAEERDDARALIDAAADLARDLGFPAEAVLLDGPPAQRILQLAGSHGVDLLVLGTHGRRGFERMILGSIAEGVLRGAKVPVLVVPGSAAAAIASDVDVLQPAR